MHFEFAAQMIEWRGPAPFYFLPVPSDISAEIKELANQLTYGWGVIPLIATIGKTEFSTSLIPRNGAYLLPIKNAVRLPEKLELNDHIQVSLVIG